VVAKRYGAGVRHFWSLLAGVVAAPVAWVLVALGQSNSASTIGGWAETGVFHTARLIEPAVYLGVAGIVLGLIATLRISPLGPTVAGLLLAAPYVGMFIAPLRVRSAVPGGWRLFGEALPLRLPLENGTLFLLGVLLFVSVFSAKRWRQWPARPMPAGPFDRTVDDTDPDLFAPPPPPASDHYPDTSPPTLAYPPAEPPRAGGSPWSSPPSGSYRRDGTAD
jgi:hypothetical protein